MGEEYDYHEMMMNDIERMEQEEKEQMEADMNKAAAFTRLPANGWQRDCPFKLGDVIFSTEMKVLPLRLPTASYGGHMGHFLLSMLTLSGLSPFGNT